MPSRTGVYVIAEAGVNHNGSLEVARALVDAAAAAGADAVKFQSFRAAELATVQAPKAAYQARNTGTRETQLQMLKQLEIGAAAQRALAEHCRKRRIDFLSSAFDPASLRLLTDTLRLKVLKIPSGEVTNGPLLLQAARSGRDLIVSTGMCTLAEVEDALGVLAFGLSAARERPSRRAFADAFGSARGQRRLKEKVVLLQCVTDYPARFQDVNLRAMDTLHGAFGLRVGLSDHSAGIAVPIAAAARGACVIEKHLTLDRTMPGPDHAASVEPQELQAMVAGIRQVEQALGDGRKVPTAAELRNRGAARKSLVAARSIARGEAYSPRNLATKRAGRGRSPLEFWDVVGQRAPRALRRDEPIE